MNGEEMKDPQRPESEASPEGAEGEGRVFAPPPPAPPALSPAPSARGWRPGVGALAGFAVIAALMGLVAFSRFGETVKTKVRGADGVVSGMPSLSASAEPVASRPLGVAPTEAAEEDEGEHNLGALGYDRGEAHGADGMRGRLAGGGPPPPPMVPATAAPLALAAATTAPLPTSGVIASTFVGGSGTAARLSDLMDRGVMVGGENVRLTAFDELGRLPYGVPGHDAVAVYAELERSRLLTEGERVHLQIALMAREGEAPPRPRMDIRLVLDRSGSMIGEKWDNAIRAAHALVDRLEPGDTFGLISYSDEAALDLSPARVGDGQAAHAAINRLAPGGATNIESALRMAAANAPEHRRPTDVALVLLISDGQATVGLTGSNELADLARASFDAGGVLTTSIGLGTDFDENTMLSIAHEGSGSYHFVRRPEDVDAILRDELEERALAVAQDLRLRIVVAPGVIVHRVYGSRVLTDTEAAEVRRTEVAVDTRLARELGITRDRREDVDEGLRMHIPTFRRGDQHVVLLEIEVPPGTDTSRIAEVILDYKDLGSASNESSTVNVTAERTSDRDRATASLRRPVKRTVLAFQAADALQQAATALERGDTAGAHLVLEERITLLRAAADLWDDEALMADANILSRYEQVIDGAWGSFPYDERRTLLMAMNYYGDERMQ